MSPAWPTLFASVLLLTGVAALLTAAVHDVIARTSPNWIALTLAITGLMLRLIDGHLLAGLLIALAVFIVAAFCWRRGWMGGGDVKLLAGAALFVAPVQAPTFITAVGIAGGILALLYLAARHLAPRPATTRPRNLLARALRAECWRIHRGGPLPYACAIAAGGLFVIL